MTAQVCALVDRPSKKSMSMIGLLLEGPDGNITTTGFADGTPRQVTLDDYARLRTEGHLLQVTPFTPPAWAGEKMVALWVGSDFLGRADALGLPPPIEPSKGAQHQTEGSFWIDTPAATYAALEAWLERAFRRVVKERRQDVARLMAWVMPDHDLTRAALWWSAPDAVAKEKELEWFARIERDRGAPVAPEAMAERLRALCEQPPPAVLNVIALVGLPLDGTREAGEQFAGKLFCEFAAFGDWFRAFARSRRGGTDKADLRRLGQEVIQTRSSDLLVSSFWKDIEPLQPSSWVVLDGLRHLSVWEAILRRPDVCKVVIVAKDRSRGDSPELTRVLQDPTEHDVPELIGKATYRFPQDQAVLERLVRDSLPFGCETGL